jgi:non-ribosomal peptide synthetase component F
VPFVALQYLAEAVQRTGIVPASLKEIFTSGEQLRITPVIREFFEQLPGCRFCNQYGPTEGHVVSELELKGDPSTWPNCRTSAPPSTM